MNIKSTLKKLFPGLVPTARWIKINALKFRPAESVFTRIYKKNEWGDAESVSGPGSNIAQSRKIREALPALIQEIEVRSVLDLPCGDFWWMKEINLDLDHYIGADVVKELVSINRAKHGNNERKFVCLDITKDNLPQVDLVFCRDLLVHFTNRDIFKTIENLKNSNSRYLLTTTYVGIDDNINIVTGGWRAIDLTKPPFNLSAPLKLIDDSYEKVNTGKSLGLWRISDL